MWRQLSAFTDQGTRRPKGVELRAKLSTCYEHSSTPLRSDIIRTIGGRCIAPGLDRLVLTQQVTFVHETDVPEPSFRLEGSVGQSSLESAARPLAVLTAITP